MLLGFFIVLSLCVNNVSAQTEPNYYVTVKPATLPDALTYTSVGRNATLSFAALWSYGPNSGQNIPNATTTIQVTTPDDKVVDTLTINTTSGIFYFNYSSSNPVILTFTPIKLVTHDGQEWNTTLIDGLNNVYGFTSNWAQVWWDTFHVKMVNSDTSSLGNVAVSVNVTYLLLPEEGLQVGIVHVPKTVQGAEVTINGVKAEETQIPGIYEASSSTFLPTAYVIVEVSYEGWTRTHTAFSFTQNANSPIWTYAVIFGSLFCIAILMLRFFMSRKTSKNSLIKHLNFPFYGAVLLAVTSVISLYWGIVGLEGTLKTFDWIWFTALGLVSFTVGVAGTMVALRKKQQALAIFAVIVPLFMNVVGVKGSLDIYGLANPWIILITSLSFSVISGYLISNSDKMFQNSGKKQENI